MEASPLQADPPKRQIGWASRTRSRTACSCTSCACRPTNPPCSLRPFFPMAPSAGVQLGALHSMVGRLQISSDGIRLGGPAASQAMASTQDSRVKTAWGRTPRVPTEASQRETVTPRGLRAAPKPRASVVDSGLQRSLSTSARLLDGTHDFDFVCRLADETTFIGSQWDEDQRQQAEVLAAAPPRGPNSQPSCTPPILTSQ